MVNAIIEYLKNKITKSKKSVFDDIEGSEDKDIYKSVNNYEWVDNLRKRQKEFLNRKY